MSHWSKAQHLYPRCRQDCRVPSEKKKSLNISNG